MKKGLLITALMTILFVSCKTDEIKVNQIGQNSSLISVKPDSSDKGVQYMHNSITISSGSVAAIVENQSDKQFNISECGAYYSTKPNFSLGEAVKVKADNYGKAEGFGDNVFTVHFDSLNDLTTYYYRLYVCYNNNTTIDDYSEENSFTTLINRRLAEVEITSTETLYQPVIECVINHTGHYQLEECGVYWGIDAQNMTKAKATQTELDGLKGKYVVDLSQAGIEREKSYCYCAYAVNELGLSKGTIHNIVVEREREYPELSTVKIKILGTSSAQATFRLDKQGWDEVNEYGYYLNGKKVTLGSSALAQGEIFEATIEGLQMGIENYIYPYAVNSDGESGEMGGQTFMTGILDINVGGDDLVYQELPPVTVDGKKYFFLDRNLGAKASYTTGKVPDEITDMGWAIQWGRPCDGHQLWSSTVVNVAGGVEQVPVIESYAGKFISNSSSWVWVNKAKVENYVEFWTAEGGLYNPCPEGYHVPTRAELTILWKNSASLCVVKAKLRRTASSGAKNTGEGQFWSCEVDPTNPKVAAYQMNTTTGEIKLLSSSGQGNFVRCVRVE